MLLLLMKFLQSEPLAEAFSYCCVLSHFNVNCLILFLHGEIRDPRSAIFAIFSVEGASVGERTKRKESFGTDFSLIRSERTETTSCTIQMQDQA